MLVPTSVQERWHFPRQGRLVAEGWRLTLIQPVCQTSSKSCIILRVHVRADSHSARFPKTEASHDHGRAGGEPGTGEWCPLYPCLCERKAVSNKKRRRYCLCFPLLPMTVCLPPQSSHPPCMLTIAAHCLCSAALLCLWPLVLVDKSAFKSACLPAWEILAGFAQQLRWMIAVLLG